MTLKFPGNTPLKGTVSPSGSVYSAISIIASSLIFEGLIEVENVPHVPVVENFLQKLVALGTTYSWHGKNALVLQTEIVKSCEAADPLLVAPILARSGEVTFTKGLVSPDITKLLLSFGASFTVSGRKISGVLPTLKPVALSLDNSLSQSFSALILAVKTEAESVFSNFVNAEEALDLLDFYKSLGITVSVDPKNLAEVRVLGNSQVKGGYFELPASGVESAFWASSAVMSCGEVTIKKAPKERLISYLSKLTAIGVHYEFNGRDLRVWRDDCTKLTPLNLEVVPDSTLFDFLPLLIPLLTKAEGRSQVNLEEIPYVKDLNLFNTKISGNEVFGPITIRGTKVALGDFNSGLAVILLALGAGSRSEILEAEKVADFFDSLSQKLNGLSARITVD